jgi:hypothetical protein
MYFAPMVTTTWLSVTNLMYCETPRGELRTDELLDAGEA